MVQSGVIAGPPYFYVCLKCSYSFSRPLPLAGRCPKCGSRWVIENPGVVK